MGSSTNMMVPLNRRLFPRLAFALLAIAIPHLKGLPITQQPGRVYNYIRTGRSGINQLIGRRMKLTAWRSQMRRPFGGQSPRNSMSSDDTERTPIAPHQPSRAEGDTICAIATGEGSKGAVGIVRISGPLAVNITKRSFRASRRDGKGNRKWGDDESLPRSHRVYYGNVVDYEEEVLDEVLLIPMLAPRSYTREDVIEFHCHGGRVCLQRVLERCLQLGARLARPGEFTFRAYLNGRIDLSQAESIGQLINAKTVGAADSALAGLSGGIGAEVTSLRTELVDLMAQVEARVDFEEDVEDEIDKVEILLRVQEMDMRMDKMLQTVKKGRLLREGFQLALVGRPNVGKSSLLNRWCGVNRAIVTPIAGTTRDVVEAAVDIGGFPATLLDTAGIRDGENVDQVERIGVERSRAAAQEADIVVMVVDAKEGWQKEDQDVLDAIKGQGGPAILVKNKVDTVIDDTTDSHYFSNGNGDHSKTKTDSRIVIPEGVLNEFTDIVSTSALNGEGLQTLEDKVAKILTGSADDISQSRGWAINQRQAEALTRAGESISRLLCLIKQEATIDMWSIDLRGAVAALGEIKGDEVQEEMLDSIFENFCIGK